MTELLEMTEQEFDGHLFRGAKSTARTLGWTTYHTLRSKGSRSGFPDRVAWRERCIFVELKSETGKPTADQQDTLTALAKAGCEVYLWRPSDLPEIDAILGHRWTWRPHLDRRPGWLTREHGGRILMTPMSLWLPDGGRVDDLLGGSYA